MHPESTGIIRASAVWKRCYCLCVKILAGTIKGAEGHTVESMWLSIPSSGKELKEGFSRAGPEALGGLCYSKRSNKGYNSKLKKLNGKWTHLYLFCRIYERVVEAPYMDIPEDASFWLGQRNAAHGFFKVSTCANFSLCVYVRESFA